MDLKATHLNPVETTLTILYDNNRFDPHFETAWGFSCLVQELEKRILFRKIKAMGIDLPGENGLNHERLRP